MTKKSVFLNAWLTKRGEDRYMVTNLYPTICRVYGTRRVDAYVTPGDSIGVNSLCKMAALVYNGGEDIETLKPKKIKIYGSQPLQSQR